MRGHLGRKGRRVLWSDDAGLQYLSAERIPHRRAESVPSGAWGAPCNSAVGIIGEVEE